MVGTDWCICSKLTLEGERPREPTCVTKTVLS
ncbi:hypothetical protein HRbin15_02460 [bacterium HR15]|nr:hypothetical protein HRbin15_02460 [bacterium HR15]